MNKDQFLKKTNGGKDFYQSVIPQLEYKDDNSFRNIISPFRDEKKPSFSIYRYPDNDNWLFYDHGDSTYKGDVFAFAAFHYGLDVKTQFREILKRMIEDLGLECDSKASDEDLELNSKKSFINFFQDYSVGVPLLDEYSVSHLTIMPSNSNETDFAVVYDFPNFQKLYVPSPKKFWYRGSKPKDFVFGLREILKRNEKGVKRDILIITGGEKDVLTLSGMGFDSVSLNSETSMTIPESLTRIFKNYRRRILLYDIDSTGLQSSKKLVKLYPQLERVLLPQKHIYRGIKDISDYVKNGHDIGIIHELIEGTSVENDSQKKLSRVDEELIEDETDHLEQETSDDELLNTPVIDSSVYEKLPFPLDYISHNFKSGRAKDVVLLSSLVTASAIFPYVYGTYRNKTIGLNVYGFIVAPAASGKGDANWSRRLVTKIEKQLAKDYSLALKEYKSKLKDNPDLIEPIPCKLCLPGNSSSASIIKMLYANNRDGNRNFGLIHETEADTLANASKQDWGGFTDILRRAFEHEPVTSGRMAGVTEIESPQLSVFLSGTPNQVKNLVTNVENGFFSRIMFYIFRTKNEWVDPFSNCSANLEAEYEIYAEQFLTYWNLQVENSYEISIELTEQQRSSFNDYFTNKVHEFEKFGQEIMANLYRMGTIHYRICMILAILREFSNTDTPDEKLFVGEIDFEIATKIVDCLLDHLIVVFHNLASKPINSKTKFTVEQKAFFNTLPMQFSKQQYEEVGGTVSISPNGAYKMVSKFISCGLIKQTQRASYQKLDTKI